ncbi:MAG: metallophosphoesterase [Desulfitobacteriaceae bacterium]
MAKNPSTFNNKTSRRDFLKKIARFCGSHWLLTSVPIGGAGILAWAEHDTIDLKIEKWDLYYPTLPEALSGKTIAQISDLHLESLQIPAERIRKAITAQKPDLLVITGDVISTRADLDKVLIYLNSLKARYGRYIVMGNNDYSHFSSTLFKRYIELLRGMGWIPLINEADYLPNLNTLIIGIDDPATAHDNVPKAYQGINRETLDSSTFRLVLAHSTDCLDDVAKYGANLLLTGHTHGGQIRLPGMKPWITNTYLGDQGIYEGYHEIKGVRVYINRGLGESIFPLRLHVPPEITLFTLHKGDQATRHVESLRF